MQAFHYTTRTLVILSIILLNACKKELEFKEPGTTYIPLGPLDPNSPSYENWTKVSISYQDIAFLTAVSDKLYFGTNTVFPSVFGVYSTNGVSQTLVSAWGNQSMFADATAFNNQIYFCGTYYVSSSSCHLLRYDPVANQEFGFPISSTPTNSVNSLAVFQGELFFSGGFLPNNFIKSKPIDRLNEADTTLGMNVNMIAPKGLFTNGTNLYAFGKGNLNSNPQYSNIAKWDGTSWLSVAYNNYDPDEYIESLAEKNDTIYVTTYKISMFGNKYNYRLKRILNNTMQTINTIGMYDYSTIKVGLVNNNIYVFGSDLSINGKHTNVLKLDGNTWVFDKIITKKVNDLEFFNGHLFAATDDGLYHD